MRVSFNLDFKKKEENLRLKALKEDHKLFVKFAKFVDEI